jgi:hypothetical protein
MPRDENYRMARIVNTDITYRLNKLGYKARMRVVDATHRRKTPDGYDFGLRISEFGPLPERDKPSRQRS